MHHFRPDQVPDQNQKQKQKQNRNEKNDLLEADELVASTGAHRQELEAQNRMDTLMPVSFPVEFFFLDHFLFLVCFSPS